ncbi:hypothetical protein EC973_005168 [Apophysomyces ossiformis]|uniref:Rhodanese domain-containing protein n=1 Tax=Apophysomyces ossiformis TaxID=679940 RepID=A0A8H7ET67_9FUNG|nr:hypothetical protein EC973_005168 [Apophysomyces ossiformis]
MSVLIIKNTSFVLDRWSDVVKKTQSTLNIAEITPADLQQELTSEAPSSSFQLPLIIDVREPHETQNGKIPHAVCLPRGVLELGIEKVIPPESERPIVLYCAGGYRSIMAVEALIRMGYKKEKLKSLQGGFGAWRKLGCDIQSN